LQTREGNVPSGLSPSVRKVLGIVDFRTDLSLLDIVLLPLGPCLGSCLQSLPTVSTRGAMDLASFFGTFWIWGPSEFSDAEGLKDSELFGVWGFRGVFGLKDSELFGVWGFRHF
jgi:hypothetical protein